MKIAQCAVTTGLALAAAAISPSPAAQPPYEFPRLQRATGDVSYVSGGIGADEAQAMREAAADYPLTLELAAAAGGPRDEYISNARVEIRDPQGASVLKTTTQGPFLLVNLPAGSYTVDVEWRGAEKHKAVEVGADRRQHVILEFAGALDNR